MKPMGQVRKQIVGLNSNIKVGPISGTSSEDFGILKNSQRVRRGIALHLASTPLQVQIDRPILCMLHKLVFIKREVDAAAVDINFDFIIGKGPRIQMTAISVGHNEQVPLIVHLFIHSNEWAIQVRRHITTICRSVSASVEPVRDRNIRC